MVKILLIVALIAFGWRVALGRWPWDYLSAKPTRGLAAFEARKLLGLPDSYSREDVIKAHRQRIASVHPDRGGSDAKVHEANAARDLLLSDLDETN